MESSETKRDLKEREAKAAQIYRDLRAMLKTKPKNELIKMIFEQIEIYQELQSVARQLQEENQKLKQPKEAT